MILVDCSRYVSEHICTVFIYVLENLCNNKFVFALGMNEDVRRLILKRTAYVHLFSGRRNAAQHGWE